MVCACCLCCCPCWGKPKSSSATYSSTTIKEVHQLSNGKSGQGKASRYDDENVLNLADRNIDSLNKYKYIFSMNNLRVLVLSNNKIKSIPYEIDNLVHLERLNLFNNQISELPSSVWNLKNLRQLNVGMNNLSSLPRGIQQLTELEILDLSYNFLDDHSLYPEFYQLSNLKALYLSDNELEHLSPEIKNFSNLLILTLRDNHLVLLPSELGELSRLRELLVGFNRLRVLPPELANCDLLSNRSTLRIEGNPLEADLADQLKLGVSHVVEYLRTDYYRSRYTRALMELNSRPPPPKNEERKARKLLRLKKK